jgi:rhomboid protease GluP
MDEREEPILITSDMLARSASRSRRPDGRVDFERGMRHAPAVVLLLIAANVAVFIWEVVTGALTSQERVVQAGALTRTTVLAGEWWRLVGATFLHGSWEHLISNCLVLYIAGMACEHAFGTLRTAAIYVASGISGSVASTLFSPGPSVGASGAIFGVVAAVIVTLYRHQHRFFLRDKRIGIVLGAWSVYQIFTGFMTPYIDNWAHVGGLVGGAAASLVLTPRVMWGQATS